MKKWLLLGTVTGLAFTSVWISSCHRVEAPVDKDTRFVLQTQVEARTREYMSMRFTNDTEGLYNISTPEYRKKVPFQKFLNDPMEITIGLRTYAIEGIDIDSATQATVWITEYLQMGGLPGLILRRDVPLVWWKVDQQWYLNRAELFTGDRKDPFSVCGSSAIPRDDDGVCGN